MNELELLCKSYKIFPTIFLSHLLKVKEMS